MKRAWLWVVLGLSFGINVGVVGTVWVNRSLPAPAEPLVLDDFDFKGPPQIPLKEPQALEEPLEEPAVQNRGDRVDEPAETPETQRPIEVKHKPRTESPTGLESPARDQGPAAARPTALNEPALGIQPPTHPEPVVPAPSVQLTPTESVEATEIDADPPLELERPDLPEHQRRPTTAERLVQRLQLDSETAQVFLQIQRSFFRDTRIRLAKIETLQRQLRLELVRRRPAQKKIDRILAELGAAHAELESTFTQSVLRSREVLDKDQEVLYLRFLSQVRARAIRSSGSSSSRDRDRRPRPGTNQRRR